MAEPLFGVKTKVNLKFNEPAIKNFELTELKTFRKFWAVDVKIIAENLAKQRLSKISGPRYEDWHRPFNQPGRTGEYDRSFRVRTRVNNASVTMVLVNTAPYSLYVESGTRARNYPIRTVNTPRLFFWSYSQSKWRYDKAVIHPGPWQSGTANPRSREANPAFGEIGGRGAWISSDATRLAVQSALRKTDAVMRARLRTIR